MRFPIYRQLDAMDCGPTCLRMIAKFYGKNYSLQTLRTKCHITREGVSMLGISDAAELIGFRTEGVKLTWEQLRDNIPFPLIVHWKQRHFVVVYNIKKEPAVEPERRLLGLCSRPGGRVAEIQQRGFPEVLVFDPGR